MHSHQQLDFMLPLTFCVQDIAFAGKDSTAAQLAAMKLKYEEAIELRRKAEAEIEAFRPVGRG